MKVITILPLKESLIDNRSGAVSIFCKDSKKYSKFKKKIKIISSDPYEKKKFFSNKNYVNNILNTYKPSVDCIYEIHNRPQYVHFIKSIFPNSKITLTFHNDPLDLRGSISSEERLKLYEICDHIIFISHWIQKRFFSGIKNYNLEKTSIIYHGVKKINKLLPKKNNILFVGKLNHSKGYDIFVEASKLIKKSFPNWSIYAIGSESRKTIFPDDSVKEIGQLSNSKVLEMYKKSKISVSNSVWPEPLGRAPMEASAMFCLPIISNVAGLKESKHISIVLKKNDPKTLYETIKFFIKNQTDLKKKQIEFNKKNIFCIKNTAKQIDNIRNNIFNLNKKKKITKYNKIKILHIADFNDDSDGRLYYSFSNKLNYGAIKLGVQTLNLNEKNYLKGIYKTGLFSFQNFNNKIYKTILNYKPDIIFLGHVFSIDRNILQFCNINNIKICRWYIDSISPEFLNQKKINKLFDDQKYIYRYFFTSNPSILAKYVTDKKKLSYIPNPTDDSIDNLKNFEKNNLSQDLFIAISHGQNRAILKKGKKDSRENLINFLIENLNELKISEFGLNNFEPIWGDNFYKHLSNFKMAVNISRGAYQNLYSSDRIASLAGNGLLIFSDKKTKFQKFFNDKEMVFFTNKNDLLKKIIFYKKNDNLRKQIAKNCYKKYHKHFSAKKIISFVINECGFSIKNFKKPIWSI